MLWGSRPGCRAGGGEPGCETGAEIRVTRWRNVFLEDINLARWKNGNGGGAVDGELMVKFLTMLFVVAPWLMPPVETTQTPVQLDTPELCSRAKTASPERAKAARYLQLKSSNDQLALQTDVQHYRLELEVNPADRFIDGRTTMTVACVEDGVTAFHFWLELMLTITEVEVDGVAAGWHRLTNPTVEVELALVCDTGEDFELAVDYEGYPLTAGLGSIVFETQGSWPVVATLSEPWFSYTWWAVKEDSRDKATGELVITVPSQLSVVANGVLVDTTSLAGNRRRYRWATAYPMSPYLFAFSATRYTTFSDNFHHTGGSMPVEFFVYPGSDVPANRAGWRRSVDILSTFSELFGLYPFVEEKYAIYQFPCGGGMEHQTVTGQGGNSTFQIPDRPRARPPVVGRHGDLRDLDPHLAQRGLRDLLGGPVVRVPERNVEPGSPSQLHGSVPP